MKLSKSVIIDRNRKAIAGLRKVYAGAKAIVLDGVSYAPADLVKILQDQIDAADAADAARATFQRTVAAQNAANAMADAVFLALKARVFSDYKSTAETLAEFGLAPPTRRKPSAETLAEAVKKREATRAARRTMGKRQKAEVTGEEPKTSPTPPATP